MTISFTILAAPKAFVGIDRTRQHNAITSWELLQPRPEIILFGDDDGAYYAAKYHCCHHRPVVVCDRDGVPLISNIFRQALSYVETDLTVYVNCDILLRQDFVDGLRLVSEKFPDFLLVGSRWDTDVSTPIDFNGDWSQRLLSQKGRRHQPGGTDYVAFPRDHWKDNIPPPFAVGRCRWDNYLISNAIEQKVPVIDATGVITAIHQDIPPTDRHPERQCDQPYIELYRQLRGKTMGNLTDSQWVLDKNGLRKRWN